MGFGSYRGGRGLAVVSLSLIFAACQGTAGKPDVDRSTAAIASTPIIDSHPGLFFAPSDLPAIRERANASPWLSLARTQIIARADEFMAVDLTPYSLMGPHNNMGTAGRVVQLRLGTLAFAGLLTGDARYTEKARAMLLAVVRQTEPDVKAQWSGHLQQSDALQGIAMAYDWLYPALSPEERTEVRAEIRRFGAVLFEQNTAWGEPSPGVASSNHNPVHFGALGLAALILGDRPNWLAKAEDRVGTYIRTFADKTGYGSEGHHYYAYGLGAALPFARALRRAGGADLLAGQHQLGLAADQVLWKLLPFEGRMLPLNDNYERPTDVAGVAGALIYDRPVQLWAWLESLRQSDQLLFLGGSYGLGYTSPFLFLWGDAPVAPQHPAQAGTPLGHQFESGRVFLRSSWTGEDAAHVSFKSGYDHHRGHDHQDENSVTFYAYGEGFLIDPQYILEGSEAHNTVSVNGAEQIKGGDGRLVAYREDPGGAFVRGQAEEAYDFVAALVGHADRKAYFVRGPVPYLLYRDDLRLEKDDAGVFVARYITYPDNSITAAGDGGAIVTGHRTGHRALLRVFSGTRPIAVTEDDLRGVTYARRGAEHPYLDWMRRMSATVTAVDPRLVTFLLPEGPTGAFPEVDVIEDEGHLIATVTYPGLPSDRFELSGTNIERFADIAP